MNSTNLISITASAARNLFNLSVKTVRSLPTLLSLPGTYKESSRVYRKQFTLVRLISAAAVSTVYYDGSTSYQNLDAHGDNPYRFMPVIQFPAFDRTSRTLDSGVSCLACSQDPRQPGYRDWDTLFFVSGYREHYHHCELSQKGREIAEKELKRVGGTYYSVKLKMLGFVLGL
jgi:hypothetical protein